MKKTLNIHCYFRIFGLLSIILLSQQCLASAAAGAPYTVKSPKLQTKVLFVKPSARSDDAYAIAVKLKSGKEVMLPLDKTKTINDLKKVTAALLEKEASEQTTPQEVSQCAEQAQQLIKTFNTQPLHQKFVAHFNLIQKEHAPAQTAAQTKGESEDPRVEQVWTHLVITETLNHFNRCTVKVLVKKKQTLIKDAGEGIIDNIVDRAEDEIDNDATTAASFKNGYFAILGAPQSPDVANQVILDMWQRIKKEYIDELTEKVDARKQELEHQNQCCSCQ